jgi:hypothetical protein
LDYIASITAQQPIRYQPASVGGHPLDHTASSAVPQPFDYEEGTQVDLARP